jgi:hypothetical protein
MDDEFPVDPTARVIIFPVYLVQEETGKSFACHSLGNDNYAVVLLTDEDSLNRYRHDIGMPERGAVKFNTPQHLLAALQSLPRQITSICFDLIRTAKGESPQTVKPMLLQHFMNQIAPRPSPS